MRNLKRNYGALHAVDDVSLEIPSNLIYGIIGRSGAGKSTLIRLISMLEKPDEGEVYYNDKRVDNLSKRSLIEERRKIGMIFQNFALFSSRNAEENIAYPMEICKMGKEHIKRKTEEMLSLVGLEGRGKDPISTLSGGQKQRIAIARALATEPEILFCDEATSALDPQTTRQILSLIKEIQGKMNLTVVMITHQMEVVRDACDRVAVLDLGRVVEEGIVRDIFASPSSSVTKDFLTSLAPVREEREKWERDKSVYVLRFRGEKTEEPVLSLVTKKTGASFNIKEANVQIVDGEEFGVTITEIGPDEETASRAIMTLLSLGVAVQGGEK